MARNAKNGKGGLTPEYIRRAYMANFAKMSAESQDAVIEALQTIRDTTHPAEFTIQEQHERTEI